MKLKLDKMIWLRKCKIGCDLKELASGIKIFDTWFAIAFPHRGSLLPFDLAYFIPSTNQC